MDPALFALAAPILALFGAIVNGLFGRYLKEPLAGLFASTMIGLGFLFSIIVFIMLLARETPRAALTLWPYLSVGNVTLNVGVVVDTLSVVMLLIITGVGFLIHLYSMGYMHGDEGYSRYFACLNLFVAAMLWLVLADSFLTLFIGWEGVGVCSFLLIGFWYKDLANSNAARKAFIVNRIGDAGFMVAMFLTFQVFGTLNISAVKQAVGGMTVGAGVVTAIALLYFLGATGKSAQIPLQVWLPDAMAGPTPVSALIHAATMVTAGVYLVARAAPLFAASPVASAVIAWVGVLTALVAAFVAFSQTDIKKILAYSTVSQLGFMFAAVGAGAYWDGVFHLFVHAFFKALLFLCAGSVIHALNGEQDIGKMGGLRKYMPVTHLTALIGTLAISGVPLLSSFFSKELILADILTSNLIRGSGNVALYALLLIAEGMTAFYMFRWYYRVFAGKPRFAADVKGHLHESPAIMTVPLMILAVFSIISGYVGLPEVAFHNYFAPWIAYATGEPAGFREVGLQLEVILVALSVVAVIVGFGLGAALYPLRGDRGVTLPDTRFGRLLARFSQNGAGFDGLYNTLFVQSSNTLADGLATGDREALDKGLVGASGGVALLARFASFLQSGYVRTYALAMLFGLAFMVLLAVFTGVMG